MFTGLIEDVGRVVALERRSKAAILHISTKLPLSEIAVGDSVAVNGSCLTVTAKGNSQLSFDVSPESLSCTTIGELRIGASVNLERALRLGDRLDGHMVSGHIDCIGKLKRVSESSGNRQLEFAVPTPQLRYLIAKGSVAIDGVSLTVNIVTSDGFSVNIIPLTQDATTLHSLKAGDTVNIETDMIGKYLERLAQPWTHSSGLSIKSLADNGFI